MALVFVYGTLKKGFPLHEQGLAGTEFRGNFRTVASYPMFIAGRWFAPMMLNEPGEGLRVRGELYRVDSALLAHLDRLESVGTPGNDRIPILISSEVDPEKLVAHAYTKSRDVARPVRSQLLSDYQDGRFIPPGMRPQPFLIAR